MDSTANILQFCRLCLVKDGVNIPIFDEQGDIRQIYLKISSCLPVKVAREDHLPKKICDGCSNKLDNFYDFWRTSAESEKQLLAWLGATGKDAAQVNVKEEDNFDEPLASDISKNDDDENKCYMFEQKVEEGPPVEINDEPPPSKRPRRTAAVKAAIAMDQNSDDDGDSGEPITKMEDDSDETDGDDREPAFVDVPSTSADDQPGPSGVSKDGSDAPRRKTRIKRPKRDKDWDPPKNKDKTKRNPKKKLSSKNVSDSDLQDFFHFNPIIEPLECQFCQEVFTSHVDFGLHSIKHKEDNTYSCHLCEFSEKCADKLIEHVRKHDSLCCIKCKKVFKNRLSAYKHCLHHPAAYVECEICGHKVKPRYLPDHRKKKHTKNVPKKIYTCSICNKSYADHTAMRVHYSQKHKEMGIDVSVVCDVCGKRLSCRDKLIKHQRSHNGHMPYVCQICKRGFAQNATLEGHMRTHTGEKPFVCVYCGKKFAHGTPYRYHVKTHTGEKQFSCDFCGKMFIARSNMKVHMKTCSPINRC